MNRLWMLVPVVIACTLVFPPLGLVAGAGGALYAHRVGDPLLRNVLLILLLVVVVLLAVLRSLSNA